MAKNNKKILAREVEEKKGGKRKAEEKGPSMRSSVATRTEAIEDRQLGPHKLRHRLLQLIISKKLICAFSSAVFQSFVAKFFT